jgi:hypothetical protein
MSLSDRLALGPEPVVSGSPCSVGELLRSLPNDEREALEAMLAGAWSASAIHDAVTGEGYDVGRQTINRHRRSECRCAKNDRSST